MDRFLALGSVLTILGILGYVVGLYDPYRLRSFSLTALMIGVAALSVGLNWSSSEWA